MTPHQKIMRAAKRGTGLRLTFEEVASLSMDNAIETCAMNDDMEDAIKACGHPVCAERGHCVGHRPGGGI